MIDEYFFSYNKNEILINFWKFEKSFHKINNF